MEERCQLELLVLAALLSALLVLDLFQMEERR
jgi:hypothetical protein